MVQVEKRMRLSNVKETDFITVILTRTIQTEEGYKFNINNIEAANDLFIRYITCIFIVFISRFYCRDGTGSEAWYEPISVVEFRGRLHPDGSSEGHYVCDVKENSSNKWFRTNDDNLPIPISTSEVSKLAYVVLFKRAE